MKTTRRKLLGSLGAVGALSALGGVSQLRNPLTRDRSATAKHFVLMFARGGWDPTLVFDPKPDSPYVDMGVGDHAAFGSGSLWFDAGRPLVTEYFTRYGAITTVCNGVNVPSIAHPSCTTRMLTGSRSAAKPDVGAMIGHSLSEDSPMPYLDIGGTAYPGPYGADMGYLGTRNQLRNLVVPNQAYEPPQGEEGWQRHFLGDAENDLVRSYIEDRLARVADIRAAEGYNARVHESFGIGLDRGHQLPNFGDFFTGMGSGKSTEAQIEIAVRALELGVSRSVHLSVSGSFDTHDDITEQDPQYEETFGAMLTLLDTLAVTPSRYGGMLLDDTVILLCSEMGRTPLLNGEGGKDHWPFTSCVLAGACVKGENIVGSSTEAYSGELVSLETGLPDANGELLNTEYILAGILPLFGIDSEPHLPGIAQFRGFHA